MSRYVLLPSARIDLREIWAFSLAEWGQVQADRYIADIEARFRAVAEDPNAGQACDQIRKVILESEPDRTSSFIASMKGRSASSAFSTSAGISVSTSNHTAPSCLSVAISALRWRRFLPPPCGEVEKCEAFFGWGRFIRLHRPPHPKSLRCATRLRPPHKGEVKSDRAFLLERSDLCGGIAEFAQH